MVEPRLERAAEEGRPGSDGVAGFIGLRARLSFIVVVIPALREWLVSTTLPAAGRWIPAFAGMTASKIPACACLPQAGRNDGEGDAGFWRNDNRAMILVRELPSGPDCGRGIAFGPVARVIIRAGRMLRVGVRG